MLLVLQIAFGIVIAYLIITNLENIFALGLAAVGIVFAVAIVGAVLYFGYEYKFELLKIAIGLIVLPILCLLLIFFVAIFGVISEKCEFIRSLCKTSLKSYQDYEVEEKVFRFIEYMSDRVNLGFLTIGFSLVVFLITYLIGNLVFEFDYFGAIATPLVYAMLFLLKPINIRERPMSKSRLVEMIERRKNLGYETKELEEQLQSFSK